MKNRNLFLTLLVLGIGLVLFGTSYAFFEYVKVGANHELIAGDIYMNFNDGTDSLSLGSVYPETKEHARSRDDNYITFTIEGSNGSEKDLYYEIDLIHGDEHSGLTRFNDKDLKFDLYEVTDTEDKLIIGGVSFDELNNTPIWVDKVAIGGHYNYDLEVFGNYYALDKSDEGVAACKEFCFDFVGGSDYSDDQDGYDKLCHGTGTVMGMDIARMFDEVGTEEMLEELDFIETIDNPQYIKETNNYNKEYKLRMWLDENIIISDTEPNADYLASDYKNHYASVKVKVSGSMEDREMSYAFLKEKINYDLQTIVSSENIKTISFTKLDKNTLESRYNNATSKLDLTSNEDAINRVYAFAEDDELIVASDKLIIFPELSGNYFRDGGALFSDLYNVENIYFNNINTSLVSDFSGLFDGCFNLTSLDLSDWDTSNIVNMSSMFYNCSSLENLDLSNFDTSNVTKMSYMFEDCKKLTSLNLSNFDTSNVIDMDFMFSYCSSLTSLDLSNWDTSNVNDMSDMFFNCTNLNKIYVGSNWNISNVTSGNNIFYECLALVGGNGTTYGSSHIDVSYAHVDSSDNPGYLTLKTS